MAGTGGISPAHVIAHTQQAAEAGADSCLIVTPYYVKPTQVCVTVASVTVPVCNGCVTATTMHCVRRLAVLLMHIHIAVHNVQLVVYTQLVSL
jgi:Dihydrodipicolinate synthetase family